MSESVELPGPGGEHTDEVLAANGGVGGFFNRLDTADIGIQNLNTKQPERKIPMLAFGTRTFPPHVEPIRYPPLPVQSAELPPDVEQVAEEIAITEGEEAAETFIAEYFKHPQNDSNVKNAINRLKQLNQKAQDDAAAEKEKRIALANKLQASANNHRNKALNLLRREGYNIPDSYAAVKMAEEKAKLNREKLNEKLRKQWEKVHKGKKCTNWQGANCLNVVEGFKERAGLSAIDVKRLRRRAERNHPNEVCSKWIEGSGECAEWKKKEGYRNVDDVDVDELKGRGLDYVVRERFGNVVNVENAETAAKFGTVAAVVAVLFWIFVAIVFYCIYVKNGVVRLPERIRGQSTGGW